MDTLETYHPTGALLHAGLAHLELALAKLTWSLCWPCSSGACAGQNLLPVAVLGFLPQPPLVLCDSVGCDFCGLSSMILLLS
jgi:hypothetical protein